MYTRRHIGGLAVRSSFIFKPSVKGRFFWTTISEWAPRCALSTIDMVAGRYAVYKHMLHLLLHVV